MTWFHDLQDELRLRSIPRNYSYYIIISILKRPQNIQKGHTRKLFLISNWDY